MHRHVAGLIAWLFAVGGALAVAAPATAADIPRFLEQATFGPTKSDIARLKLMSYQAWLDEQFGLPLPSYPDPGVWPPVPPSTCDNLCLRDNYTIYPLQIRFYRNAVTAPDQLRQRVAFALSQLFVVSAEDVNLRMPSRLLPYLKVLDKHAFGNFRQLLTDITLNPAMAWYLDTIFNQSFAPNENFGREILQLFTIGPNMLNMDGTVQLDAAGVPIPAYDQDTVTAFARVFTGWVFAPALADGTPNFRDPLVPGLALQHDTKAKTLLNGVTLPAGQNAPQDLQGALDNIFAHPNVAPFVSLRLIRNLVTSNPSPDYVRRVATVFRDESGDMKSVIRAILLDPEARAGGPVDNPVYGHLKEPVLWLTGVLRAFKTTAATTDFVLADGFSPAELRVGQDLFRSPTVFNYFPPDHVAIGDTVIGPEFKIYSTSTALARTNLAYLIVWKKMSTYADLRPLGTWLDLSYLEPLAADPPTLVHKLNKLLLHKSMTTEMRDIITSAVTAINPDLTLERVRAAVYLVITSPQYLVER